MRPAWLSRSLLIFGGWTAIGVVSLGHRILDAVGGGKPLSYRVVAFTLESVWLWARLRGRHDVRSAP